MSAPPAVSLSARPRTVFGKRCRQLRRAGWTPANVFGPGTPSLAIEIHTHELEHLLTHVRRATLLGLAVEGKQDVTVLIKRVERRPTTDELYHVDFYRISMTHTLRTTVPLVLVGEAPAVRAHDATALRDLDSLAIECLPGDLPSRIEVSIEGLTEIDAAIHVRDLVLPPGVICLTNPDDMIVHVIPPRVEVSEGAAPAEEVEGEAPAAEGQPSAQEESK